MQREWDRIIQFNEQFFPNWRKRPPMFYTNALAGEVGEACSIVKVWEGGGTNPKAFAQKHLIFECIDIFIYTALLLERLGVNYDVFRTYLNLKLDELYLRKSEETTDVKHKKSAN